MNIYKKNKIDKKLLDNWIRRRNTHFLGTNYKSSPIPIQDWYRFKEAFTPEIVVQAIEKCPVNVKTCIDPFAGSGTTAVAGQMLGINTHSYEVNPFLYDLICAKTCEYNISKTSKKIDLFFERIRDNAYCLDSFASRLPPSFIEPGRRGKWIFDQPIADVLSRVVSSLECERDINTKRLLRVAVGSILSDVSNVVINGKGRRYRNNWHYREVDPASVIEKISAKLKRFLGDIKEFEGRHNAVTQIELCDSRQKGRKFPKFELAIFSPPYPNSFDYTDVYNLELWTLGYLSSREENKLLRERTLSSHVQLSRNFLPPPNSSPLLSKTMRQLIEKKDTLWHNKIPFMIGSYFSEMETLLRNLYKSKSDGGEIHLVVGNSKYAGIEIHTADIISEIATDFGAKTVSNIQLRNMRTSPQQGGNHSLAEKLLILR
jgi:hypothetical protein